ncbi:MAG: hypothetical protein GEV08_07775 [Acidimicrobiia bacterium]|nr:hypothetical protein [Acidimicrobiia bacterium]
MTPFDERVEHARRLIRRTSRPVLPVAYVDQLGAASCEARGCLDRIGDIWETFQPSLRRYEGDCDSVVGVELAARILAVYAEATLCPHLRRGGPQPAFYRLETRRLTCRRCYGQRFRRVVAVDRCDLCQQPADTFTEFGVQLGPMLVLGNAGGCCPTPAATAAGDR